MTESAHFTDGAAAMEAPFEPAVPCRMMPTRPCVDIGTLHPIYTPSQYRTTECRDACHRHPTRDTEDPDD